MGAGSGGDGPKTHPYVDYGRSVSADRGRTWSKLKPVGPGCARPRLLQLGGTMLLSGQRASHRSATHVGGRQQLTRFGCCTGGRHRNDHTSDVLLWTATDGSGESWTPYSLSAAHNAGTPDPSLRYDANVNSTTFSPRETNRLLLKFLMKKLVFLSVFSAP